ncbi:MAG: tRNA (adenosine(37)-N6)-threonylcarbamoyltransferase complex transferase subunit TsaD [Bdellovibrionales bacterium]|nr:tRNA (adenosine(37)-N6)-threonylcarbamoyltransferase complex transferase subunit TsaD [Bdellovibrionales bacterium]
MLLSIETSCDETAVALLDPTSFESDLGGIVRYEAISSQAELHRPYGGVVPELAARNHTEVLGPMVEEALGQTGLSLADICAVAVTVGPGLKGCLLVGTTFAKSLAYRLGVPLIPVNHLLGHLAACDLRPPSERPAFPRVTLLVSGGHTALLHTENERRLPTALAQTRDDAAGEAFDKTATLLGLPYPGGPALSHLAASGDPAAFELPRGVAADPASFSFSGFKTAVRRIVEELATAHALDTRRSDVAASVERAIVETLIDKTRFHLQSVPARSLILTGGVAANKLLRTAMSELARSAGVDFHTPPLVHCTDNAAMIGAEALQIRSRKSAAFASWEPRATPTHFLGPDVSATLGVRPRWPIEEGWNIPQ